MMPRLHGPLGSQKHAEESMMSADDLAKIDGVDPTMYIRTGRRDKNALGIFGTPTYHTSHYL